MDLFARLFDRLIPALLMAASVVLLSAGLFAYAPIISGDQHVEPTSEPGDPNFEPSPAPTGIAVVSPLPTLPAVGNPSDPAASPPIVLPPPSADPFASDDPNGSPDPNQPGTTLEPGATLPPGTTPRPGATTGPTTPPRPAGRARATRIVIPAMGIDLAVVSGDLHVAGNRDNFPLCDVAQYLVEYSQPGESGTTYIYAHARRGMFLPLLEASRKRDDGRSMVGMLVEVYTSANRLHLYEIYLVKRHATDLSLAHQLPPGGQQLVMQTSEGPRGTIPKLQVAAKPISVLPASARDANPNANPRVCR